MILNPSPNRRGNLIHTSDQKSLFYLTPFVLIFSPNICPWNSFVGNLLSVELGGQGLDHMAYTVASWGKRRRSSLACCAFWRPGALLTVVYCTECRCRRNATNFNQLWPPPAIVLRLFVIGWRNSLRLRVRRVCQVTKNDPPTLTKLLKMVDDQKLEFYEVFKKLVTDILPMPLSSITLSLSNLKPSSTHGHSSKVLCNHDTG